MNRARACHEKGNDAEALLDVEKALAMSPGNEYMLLVRGEIYESLGRRDKAFADYRAVLDRNRANEAAWNALKRLGR